VRPTGVADPMVDRDNELGLVALQWEGLKRFWGAVRRPAGWRPGEVSFSENYVPVPVSHLAPVDEAAMTGAAACPPPRIDEAPGTV